MSFGDPQPPQWGQQPPAGPPPTPPSNRPGWTRKRIIIPAALALFFVGVIIGTSGSGDTKTVSDAKPAPAVTQTVTAKPAAKAAGKVKPAPTVTVTETATVKPKAKPKAKPDPAPEGKAVFKVWGTASAGADITYGSDGENLDGSGLPMTKTLTVKDDALYYAINAQLQGGGDIQCSVTIDGKTKTGHARGGYNICSAQLNADFMGGFS
ncbi:hypothetical protein [Streptomyces sp. NBC_00370]|uniref:hypothetical protein n=1 Tax=Streptomyces sp. NBC_00370 TaxID=2975728 RepID=UPI002E260C13